VLEEIAIENLGVIDSARITLGPGLTVVTGETGAGKTMLLTGLGLLLGAKADAATVRPGAASAVVEGRLVVEAGSPAATLVDEAGGAVDDDGGVVVVRAVAAGGRSRAHVGGRGVPQAVLSDLAAELVTVHGQADQLRLRSASRQRGALDAFAGSEHADRLARYRERWAERAALATQVDQLVGAAQERAREAELLRLGLAEVERVDPRPGEDDELAAQVARLTNVEELRGAAQVAHDALSGLEEADAQPGAVALLDRAWHALDGAARQDAGLAELARRVHEATYAVQDAAVELAAYVGDLSADPAALEAAHARRAELAGLTRAYGATVDDVLIWARDAGLRLLDLDDDGSRVDAARARLDELDAELEQIADGLSGARAAAARELADAVTAELAGLAMTGAILQVRVEVAETLGPYGRDTVAFDLVPHAGAPARPLGKGASGGELSRVMLAIEVALATRAGAATHRLPTFVFDEVDAGVGGRAAVEVGRRLAGLARSAQVLVVTHLAQVAAFADAHVVVTKSVAADADAPVTASGVRVVGGQDRVAELARMLSGQEDSPTALEHASELLAASVVEP
jgi:DNA repair protein RecN (Recombination protein N)